MAGGTREERIAASEERAAKRRAAGRTGIPPVPGKKPRQKGGKGPSVNTTAPAKPSGVRKAQPAKGRTSTATLTDVIRAAGPAQPAATTAGAAPQAPGRPSLANASTGGRPRYNSTATAPTPPKKGGGVPPKKGRPLAGSQAAKYQSTTTPAPAPRPRSAPAVAAAPKTAPAPPRRATPPYRRASRPRRPLPSRSARRPRSRARGLTAAVPSGAGQTSERGPPMDALRLRDAKSNHLSLQGGPGVAGTAEAFVTSTMQWGGLYTTRLLIDLTGLNSGGTAGDVIGKNGSGAAYIARLTRAECGVIKGGRMVCLELPAGGDTDIDLYAADEATGVEDTAISALTETQIINAGVQALGTTTYFSANPASGQYLYLVGQGTSNATYTAGRLLIEIWGT